MRGQVLIAGVVILIICGGLAGADFVFSERPHMLAQNDQNLTPPPDIPLSSSSSVASVPESSSSSVMASSEFSVPTLPPQMSSSFISSEQPMTSSSAGFVKKGVSTKKASSVNVDDVLAKLQLVQQQTGEASFLLLTSPDRSKVKTSVLLRNNDRAFLFSWTESDNVKTIFSSLKQALQEQFSGKVSGLVDETRTPDSGPPVDYLSFTDPALSVEQIIFLRVRNRLYEIHVAKNGADLLEQLVAELSK